MERRATQARELTLQAVQPLLDTAVAKAKASAPWNPEEVARVQQKLRAAKAEAVDLRKEVARQKLRAAQLDAAQLGGATTSEAGEPQGAKIVPELSEKNADESVVKAAQLGSQPLETGHRLPPSHHTRTRCTVTRVLTTDRGHAWCVCGMQP